MSSSQLRLLEATDNTEGESGWTEVALPARPSVVVTVLTAVAAIVLVGSILLTGRLLRTRPEVAFVHVTVARGDTLWSLAHRHCGPGQYLPKAIREIRDANRLRTSALMPGQELVIPVRVPAGTPRPMSLAQAPGSVSPAP